MKEKVLFPDDIHFHEKNFKSLVELIETNEIDPIFIKDFNHLKAKYGDYNDQKTFLLKYYDSLCRLSKDELFEKFYYGISIFSIAKAELLSYLMPKPNWYSIDISSNEKFIFDKAFEENREALLLNLSIVIFWFDFWKDTLKKQKGLTFCMIFSGSLIYVKTLSFLLQNTQIRVFVLEHFFTGNDYYFEEKYTHIANNSDIKFPNVFNKLICKFNSSDMLVCAKDRIKAVNKILLANNKNVKQPNRSKDLEQLDFSKPTLLILGQVINDFSIIETKLSNINSLQSYKKIIKTVLEQTEYNIIFKAHPWERQKINIRKALTKDVLNNYVLNDFEKEHQKRILIVEDYNLQQLVEVSSLVVALSSQSLLEAAYIGKKPCQIGDAFFGHKGFTNDFVDEVEFVKSIIGNSINGDLAVDEYERLMMFFTVIFQYHLVSIYNSGKSTIKEKMVKTQLINIVSVSNNMELSPSQKKDTSSSNIPIIDAVGQSASVKNKIIENLVISISSEKKIQKFKSNPKKFFEDSEFWLVRFIGKIY
jgi:hypothetical protein